MPHTLPQRSGDRLFLTDGGLETSLIFHHGLELPDFAAFPLLEHDAGRAALRDYFAPYLALAAERDAGFLLDTPTWRANTDRGAGLGYDEAALAAVNRGAVRFARELAEGHRGSGPVLVSGCIGPRGDGYEARELMSAEEAERYHAPQLRAFAEAGADLATALTLNYVEEAVGITRAAAGAGLPVVISFTVETDGRLPSGQALGEAVEQVDAETDARPEYFMINCAHPSHFAAVVGGAGAWRDRIGGLRANASSLSHAELDEAEELDEGDPAALGAEYRALRSQLPRVTVLGGCCGTDERHVAAVCTAWAA